MTGEHSTGDTERVQKTGMGLPAAVEYDKISHEIELLARDSMPKLDLSTVRLEAVEQRKSGNYAIVISGEKCDIYHGNDRQSHTGTDHGGSDE